MTGNLAQLTATPRGPEALSGLPCPERCVELGFATAAIELPGGGYLIGPLHLRTSPVEAAVLALAIQHAVGPAAIQEALLREHGHGAADTGVLLRVLSGLQQIPHPTPQPKQ